MNLKIRGYTYILVNKMKTNTWIIEVYFDDDRTNLLFTKKYKNINEIKSDFNLKSDWFYDIFRRKDRNYKTYKTSFINKFKRIVIHKTQHRKDGDITSTFSI